MRFSCFHNCCLLHPLFMFKYWRLLALDSIVDHVYKRVYMRHVVACLPSYLLFAVALDVGRSLGG